MIYHINGFENTDHAWLSKEIVIAHVLIRKENDSNLYTRDVTSYLSGVNLMNTANDDNVDDSCFKVKQGEIVVGVTPSIPGTYKVFLVYDGKDHLLGYEFPGIQPENWARIANERVGIYDDMKKANLDCKSRGEELRYNI